MCGPRNIDSLDLKLVSILGAKSGEPKICAP